MRVSCPARVARGVGCYPLRLAGIRQGIDFPAGFRHERRLATRLEKSWPLWHVALDRLAASCEGGGGSCDGSCAAWSGRSWCPRGRASSENVEIDSRRCRVGSRGGGIRRHVGRRRIRAHPRGGGQRAERPSPPHILPDGGFVRRRGGGAGGCGRRRPAELRRSPARRVLPRLHRRGDTHRRQRARRQGADGLPSIATEGEVLGPSDISITGSKKFVLSIGIGGSDVFRNAFGLLEGSSAPSSPASSVTGPAAPFADALAYEATANPEPTDIDSNPVGILRQGESYVVADAGANAIVKTNHKGEFSTIAVLPGVPARSASHPTRCRRRRAGPGRRVLREPTRRVPVRRRRSKIWRIVPGQAPTVYASGLTNVTDLAFAPDGTLYAVEIAKNGLLTGPPGAIVSIPGVAVRRPSWSTACCSPTGSPSATARSTSRRERRCPASDRCCASGSTRANAGEQHVATLRRPSSSGGRPASPFRPPAGVGTVRARDSLTTLVAVALLSVRERIRDYGVLKAIGLTPRQITSTRHQRPCRARAGHLSRSVSGCTSPSPG